MEEPRTAADAPPKCEVGDCADIALVSFSWDWGQTGKCCAAHQSEFVQKQDALGRRVTFAPLQAASAAPLTRDQRTRLQAEVLVLKEEAEDLKARGTLLYQENVSLSKQLQALSVRSRENEAQLKDAAREIERLQVQLGERDAQFGEMTDELNRLRTIAKFSDTTVVDGPAAPPQKAGKATSKTAG